MEGDRIRVGVRVGIRFPAGPIKQNLRAEPSEGKRRAGKRKRYIEGAQRKKLVRKEVW